MSESKNSNLSERLRAMASDSMGAEPGDRQIMAEAADALDARRQCKVKCKELARKVEIVAGNLMKISLDEANLREVLRDAPKPGVGPKGTHDWLEWYELWHERARVVLKDD